jgi:predicted dehydrogenase
MKPLVIGTLGAARITENGIVTSSRATGSRLVAIAARDRAKADEFARVHRIDRVFDNYDGVIADSEIEAIYNPLVNSEHTRWNLAAIAAGKHVLCEKPFANNAVEAAAVRDAGIRAGVVVSDGSHFMHHPLTIRLHELLASGAIGTIESISTTMATPAPPATDPRWALELGGGALMDLGCYSLRALRGLSPLLGGEPELVLAIAHERAGLDGVDESGEYELKFPSGARAVMSLNMAATDFEMTFEVTGTLGNIRLGNFALPHLGPDLWLTINGVTTHEALGTISSYCYQLQAFIDAIREGTPLVADAADAVVTMQLIDDCYLAAGMQPRPSVS